MSHPEPVANVSTSTWPEETELCFAPGGTRVMLTIQRRLVRIVIQDSIDILRATLIFENAFPEGPQSLQFARHALVSAAEKQLPATLSIHTWLLQDDDYIAKITPLVSAYYLTMKDRLTFSKTRARIPLFRSEVKELCNTIMQPVFLAMTSTPQVKHYVEQQISGYRYTFPTRVTSFFIY